MPNRANHGIVYLFMSLIQFYHYQILQVSKGKAMQTFKQMMMHQIVKILLPDSPAYGNTIPFAKQESLEEIMNDLQVGDIIFTKTNNSVYQMCRDFLETNYDHVSIIINKTQVLHISPPIISKLELKRVMQKSREPAVYRFDHDEKSKETLLSLLISCLGDKYNESAISSMFKNKLMERIFKPQEGYQFSFQNLKYTKICTSEILYALCKALPTLQQKLGVFVKDKTKFDKIGFILPDQMMNFFDENGAKVVFKSSQCSEKTVLDKAKSLWQIIQSKLEVVSFFANRTLLTKLNLTKKLSGFIFGKFIKNQSPLIKVLSLIYFVYELKYGNKFNKALLLYSVVATLMFYEVIPKEFNSLSILPKL